MKAEPSRVILRKAYSKPKAFNGHWQRVVML